MKIIYNTLLAILFTMLLIQVNCKRSNEMNDRDLVRTWINQDEKRITRSRYETETIIGTHSTHTSTEHGVETKTETNEMNNGKKINRSRHSESIEHHDKTETIIGTRTQKHTEHGVETKTETSESKMESESPKETSIEKEKYKVMFLVHKPRNIQDTLEQIPTHGNKKQRQN